MPLILDKCFMCVFIQIFSFVEKIISLTYVCNSKTSVAKGGITKDKE